MKTYRTWEMLRELAENPNKEFEKVSDGLHVKTNENEELRWSGEFKLDRLNDTWVEVIKKPVDFMAAVESGKAVSVHYSGARYEKMGLDELLYQLTRDYDSSSVRWFILYGKWYIED